ncbi:MAG TPA: SRPBCC family protein [Solirubrobacteraceae bacterium]|nr:SRPBCC family protein [Solirubrobacteraceae bacterium]
MASFSHTINVPKAPGEVFPWLLEEDKVPQWTTRLRAYEVLGGGAIGHGTRIRQVLTVSGQALDIELEITRYDPPGFAESRFSTNGLEVGTTYALRAAGAGTELTQTLEGKANGFKARLLVPVVQPKLEAKLTEDLERLRELLS